MEDAQALGAPAADTNGLPAEGPRWREVVECAADIFYKRGYDGSSIRDICESLGVSKGTLYHYIASKEDLLFAVVQDQHQRYLEVLRALADLDVSSRRRFEEFVRRHCFVECSEPRGARIYGLYAYRLSGTRRQQAVEFRKTYENVFVELITAGMADGWIRQVWPPTDTARILLAMMNSLHTWFDPDGKYSPDQTGSMVAGILAEGIQSYSTRARADAAALPARRPKKVPSPREVPLA